MRARADREFVAVQRSPSLDVWASAAIDEILSALYERTLTAGR